MPIPQPVQDALQAVQDDFDALTSARATAATATAALAQAQADKTAADAAVAAAQSHLGTDLAALVALEQSTYS